MVPFIKIGAMAARAHNRRHAYAYELLKAGAAPASRIANLLVGPFSRRLSPFSTVYFGEDEFKPVGESITWPFSRFFSPFKNGENGKNGVASKRRREATKSHPALKHLERLPAL